MHVKTTTVRQGNKTYRYLSLVESYRDGAKMRHRTVARLGEASALASSGQLDRIVAALRTHAEGRWLSGDEIEATGAPGFGAIAAVHAYFSRLGLEAHFNALGDGRRSGRLADAVFAMVANRLLCPSSKRRTILDWLERDVALPDGVGAPSLDQCYRAVDTLCAAKDTTEVHLYRAICDLTNLDLRLCCYDLTSTYFETTAEAPEHFSSLRFGYSRDHRRDRPQVMIGLLVTGDGIPIAHHVFPGNTKDATTLPAVMADLQTRFGVGKIALVADRGLISEDNVEEVRAAGFDHVLATRLHRDAGVAHVLEQAAGATDWVSVDTTTRATEITHGGRRHVVVFSAERKRRDDHRREELLARTEDLLIALAERVGAKRLVDPAKIGAAADRILRDSGVGRCFTTTIAAGRFFWDFDAKALDYEERLLAGRYVLTTSLAPSQASTADVVRHYKMLQHVEARFRVMKDFLGLRPVFHWTEQRVRGHIALCVIAATIEALMGNDLSVAQIADPDLDEQTITVRRALAELGRIRRVTLDAGEQTVTVVTRRNAFQARLLGAFGVDTKSWSRATMS